jgi:hypothetical protein
LCVKRIQEFKKKTTKTKNACLHVPLVSLQQCVCWSHVKLILEEHLAMQAGNSCKLMYFVLRCLFCAFNQQQSFTTASLYCYGNCESYCIDVSSRVASSGLPQGGVVAPVATLQNISEAWHLIR